MPQSCTIAGGNASFVGDGTPSAAHLGPSEEARLSEPQQP